MPLPTARRHSGTPGPALGLLVGLAVVRACCPDTTGAAARGGGALGAAAGATLRLRGAGKQESAGKHSQSPAGRADSAGAADEPSWLDRQREVALRVLRRRANAERKEKRRQHVSSHGVDADAIARAEELQVRCPC